MPGVLATLRPATPPVDGLQVPVITGEGVGPELWEATRPVLEAAVAKAYGTRRTLEWLELDLEPPPSPESAALPAEVVDAFRGLRVGLRAPSLTYEGRRSAGAELRARLELATELVELRPVRDAGPDTVVFVDAREGAAGPVELAPGSSGNAETLGRLHRELPVELRRLRFASRDRVDAYRRFRGMAGGGVPEVGLGAAVVTRQGTQRVVAAALAAATKAKRARVTVVHDPRSAPLGEAAFVEWAYRLAEADLGPQVVFSHREFVRIAVRHGATVAGEERAASEAAGVPMLDDVELGTALQAVASGSGAFDLAVASATAAPAFVGALAARLGGEAVVPVVALNPATGHAVFETLHGAAPRHAGEGRANPTGLILAGEQLLRWIGWDEAAELLLPAIRKAIAGGKRTADLRGTAPAGTTAGFAEAVQAAL